MTSVEALVVDMTENIINKTCQMKNKKSFKHLIKFERSANDHFFDLLVGNTGQDFFFPVEGNLIPIRSYKQFCEAVNVVTSQQA